MRKNEFDDYIVRGWESGANLFYDGRIYFSQCDYIEENKHFHFYVYSFKAKKYEDNSFSPYMHRNGGYVEDAKLIDKIFETKDEAKKLYFSSKIFDGKSFWEIGMDFEWLEDDGPIIYVD